MALVIAIVFTVIYGAGAEQTLFTEKQALNWVQARNFCEIKNLTLSRLNEKSLRAVITNYPELKGRTVWSDGRCTWKNMAGHEIGFSSVSIQDKSGQKNCLTRHCLLFFGCRTKDDFCLEKTQGNVGYYSCKTVNEEPVDIIPRDNDLQNGDCYSFSIDHDDETITRKAVSCGKRLTEFIFCYSDNEAKKIIYSTKPAITTNSHSTTNSALTTGKTSKEKPATTTSTASKAKPATATSTASKAKPATTTSTASKAKPATTTCTTSKAKPATTTCTTSKAKSATTTTTASKAKPGTTIITTSKTKYSTITAIASVPSKNSNDKNVKTTAKISTFTHARRDNISFTNKSDVADIDGRTTPEKISTENPAMDSQMDLRAAEKVVRPLSTGGYAGIGIAVFCLCSFTAAAVGFHLKRRRAETTTSATNATTVNHACSSSAEICNEGTYGYCNDIHEMKMTSLVNSPAISFSMVNGCEYAVVSKAMAANLEVIITSGDDYINTKDSTHLYDGPASAEESDTIYYILQADDPTVEKTVKNDLYVPWKND